MRKGWIVVGIVAASSGACTRANPIFGDDDGTGKTSAVSTSDTTAGVADTQLATSRGTMGVGGTSTGAPSSSGVLDGPRPTTGLTATTGSGEGTGTTGSADGLDAPEPIDLNLPMEPCCTAQPGPGCGTVAIEGCVCAADPECCTVAYDLHCASLAVVECGLAGCLPPLGDCCVGGMQAGCESWEIMSCVCFTQNAPECCNGVWDANCAYIAVNACAAALC